MGAVVRHRALSMSSIRTGIRTRDFTPQLVPSTGANTGKRGTTGRDGSRHRKMGASKSVVHTSMTASSPVEMLSAAPICSGVPGSGPIGSPTVLDQTHIPTTTALTTSPARSNLRSSEIAASLIADPSSFTSMVAPVGGCGRRDSAHYADPLEVGWE